MKKQSTRVSNATKEGNVVFWTRDKKKDSCLFLIVFETYLVAAK